jgi:DNA-binding MarR family transcriptional regulator
MLKWVLHALCKGPHMTSTLARRFNVTDPTMTRIVDGLVRKGYVERHHDAADRRRIFLTITEPGARIGEQVHEQLHTALARFLSPLTPDQLEEITRAFQHLQSLLPPQDDQVES